MTHTLDAKNLMCPLPVLRAKKALQQLQVGEILEILATDPAAPHDFVSFCDTTGHELLDSREADGVFSLRIRKSL